MTPIVVDNASSDETVDRVRQPRRMCASIANRENRGFAAAANQGVREASESEFILLLNPDVELLTAVDQLVESAGSHGLAAGRLVDRGRAHPSGIYDSPLPDSGIADLRAVRDQPAVAVESGKPPLSLPGSRSTIKPAPVEQPAGAFLMVRRDVWEKLGGFDEQFYPVWFEDVDFCRRAVDAGYRIAVCAVGDGAP